MAEFGALLEQIMGKSGGPDFNKALGDAINEQEHSWLERNVIYPFASGALKSFEGGYENVSKGLGNLYRGQGYAPLEIGRVGLGALEGLTPELGGASEIAGQGTEQLTGSPFAGEAARIGTYFAAPYAGAGKAAGKAATAIGSALRPGIEATSGVRLPIEELPAVPTYLQGLYKSWRGEPGIPPTSNVKMLPAPETPSGPIASSTYPPIEMPPHLEETYAPGAMPRDVEIPGRKPPITRRTRFTPRPTEPFFDINDPRTWPKQGEITNEDIGRVGAREAAAGRPEYSPAPLMQSRVPISPEAQPPSYERYGSPSMSRVPTSEYESKYPEGYKPPSGGELPRALPVVKAETDVTKFGDIKVGDNIGLDIPNSPSYGTVSELFTKEEAGIAKPYAKLTDGTEIDLTGRYRSLGPGTPETLSVPPVQTESAPIEAPIKKGDQIALKALGPNAKPFGTVTEVKVKQVPVSIQTPEGLYVKRMQEVPYAKLDNGKEVDLTRFGRVGGTIPPKTSVKSGTTSPEEVEHLLGKKPSQTPKGLAEENKTLREKLKEFAGEEKPKSAKQLRREKAYEPPKSRSSFPSAEGTMKEWYEYALATNEDFVRYTRAQKELPKTEKEYFNMLRYFYANMASGSLSSRTPKPMVSALTKFARSTGQ